MPIEYFFVFVYFPFPCHPYRSRTFRFKIYGERKMVDDWLIVVGLVTAPLNYSQVAADALSCSSTVRELALF